MKEFKVNGSLARINKEIFMKALLLPLAILSAISCSSNRKITFQAIEPAKEDRVAKIKTITFDSFKNDNFGVGGMIEGLVGGYSLDESGPYFKVVERKDLRKLFAEQRLSSSWTVDPEQRVRIGKLVGAQAILGGEVLNADYHDSSVTESRSRCSSKDSKGRCKAYESYNITCTRRTFNLSVLVKLVETSTGDYAFTDTLSKKNSYTRCSDGGSIPGGVEALTTLTKELANDLIGRIAPTKHELQVALIEDLDDVDDVSDMQEKFMESGLEFAKAGRLDKARSFFKRLGESLSWKSYVANYNYAVLLEASGQLDNAKKFYDAADHLALEPVEEINDALKRINTRIKKGRKLASQLSERE